MFRFNIAEVWVWGYRWWCVWFEDGQTMNVRRAEA